MKKFAFFIILAISFVFRVWSLGSIPSGLTPDEAALGYNAYSILKSGKDEWGEVLPIIFRSFGDYKPGAYVYFDIPFVAVFGLNEFSTRLPSALAGVLIVYFLYLIAERLFKNKNLSLFISFIASINPWLIYFSRGAWEANVSLALTLGGVYFFLKSLEKSKHIITSALFFGLTLLTYQGAKLSTLIILAILVLIYWKEFWNLNKKHLTLSLLFGVCLSIPIFTSFFLGKTNRLNIYSIFSYERPAVEIANIVNADNNNHKDLLFSVFHSENLNYLRAIAGRYFNNFSGEFLFFEGDWANPTHTAPYQGVMLLSDILTLPIGIYFLFKRKIEKGQLLIFLWLILSPLSSAFSRDQLNSVRDLNLAIPFVIISGVGAYNLLKFFMSVKNGAFGVLFYSVLVLVSLVYFADAYFIHVPSHNSNLWRYGYKQAFEFVDKEKSNYESIIFEQSFNQPYIYYLFYFSRKPQEYQEQQKMIDSDYKGDVGFVPQINKIKFSKIDWEVIKKSNNTLVVANATNIPQEIIANPTKYEILREIKYLNNRDVAFYILHIK